MIGAEAGPDPRDDAPGHDVRPSVALPPAGVPTPLLIALGVVLALALFLMLNAHRRALNAAETGPPLGAVHLPPPPPPLALPPAPLPPPPPAPIVIHERAPTPPRNPFIPQRPPQPIGLIGEEPLEPARPPASRNPVAVGPALVVDLTDGGGASVNGAGGAHEGAAAALSGQDEAARATLIRGRSAVIPQGAIIAAVLETPLDSDRPGLARALTSQDARGFDGSRILIPRGSRLIGEFKADTSPGLRRILVTWTRLIRPDGVAIRIGSPVSDSLGGAGVAGSVNTHFLSRFAGAVLQSALAVGVNLASASAASNNSSVIVALPAQGAQLGAQLVPNVNRPPTIKVREGAEIAVLVARDLDFSGTPAVR